MIPDKSFGHDRFNVLSDLNGEWVFFLGVSDGVYPGGVPAERLEAPEATL